ncbi:MAG: ethylbenzene dehydrogenase [Rhodospirillales bacterium]|nr:ethylbenzene dehydrogenase [Rhodospirillales bacterium]
MTRFLKPAGTALVLGGALALVVSTAQADEFTVTAVKGSAAPTLDGDAGDAVWGQATATSIKAVKGVNFGGSGETTGSIKAAYVGDMLYVLLQWDDPTLSYQRAPYKKQADGSWAKLKDPDDKGGDDNKYYEDKAALIWNINESIFGFERRGCQLACHAGEPGKPYGNKYTAEEGELGDIWHLKNVRSGPVGQVDDQYLDHTKYDKEKAPGAGRKSDPNTGGGYKDIALKDGKPEFMSKDAKPANAGGTYWVVKGDEAPFDDSKFKAGDEVASILIAPYEGDRGDIKVSQKWADGKWTVEMSRKLATGSKFDVQFSDMAKEYTFGVAFFDNAQVRHAYQEKPLKLAFQK